MSTEAAGYDQKTPHGQPAVAVVTQPVPLTGVIAPVPHQNWMVPAVLTCIFCFWPIGIFSIIYASKANSAAARGDGVETELYSSRARNLVIITLSVGLIIISISIIVRTTSGTY
uniref:Proline-rich transmembrane protein 1-like n=1 Tax=Crassostrea virginica TaxID=6565 RepID=A0A8B8AFH1_CRAVI|nr:proline-rich transmembrane protein 1-like [Crassostrea virginica]